MKRRVIWGTAWMALALATIVAGAVHAGERPLMLAQPNTELERPFDPDRDAGAYLRLKRSERSAALSTETREIRIADQFGLGYLPLIIMRTYGLIEKHVGAEGLRGMRVTWLRYPSGKAMNAALRTGLLDFASGGVPPLLRAWEKSSDIQEIKGVAALCSMPMYLNTVNPGVDDVGDFGEKDRIALPARLESSQAVVLQMALARTLGRPDSNRLDDITVSMSHPDGMDAMLSGRDGITAHFTGPPFQYQELLDERVSRIVDSYEVLGDSATFNLLWARSQFFEQNPRTFRAVYNAVLEAVQMIKDDPRAAAKAYLLRSGGDITVDLLERIIRDPRVEFTPVPRRIMRYAEFMHDTGSLARRPADWRDVFFPLVHNSEGS